MPDIRICAVCDEQFDFTKQGLKLEGSDVYVYSDNCAIINSLANNKAFITISKKTGLELLEYCELHKQRNKPQFDIHNLN